MDIRKNDGEEPMKHTFADGTIRLVATDLDGTLLNSEKQPPADFEDWVLAHPQVKVVLSSGRQYYNLYELLPACRDQLLYIADNGGFVFEKGKMLYCDGMDAAEVQRVIGYFRQIPETTMVLSGEKAAYVESATSDEGMENVRMYYRKREVVERFEDALARDVIVKIAVYVPGHRAQEVYRTLPDWNDGVQDSVLESVLSGDSWIDVAHMTANKGAAIRYLQGRYDIPASQCLAFGDFLNDQTMLDACGLAYVMENGYPEMVRNARYLAPSNEEEGVMQVLREREGVQTCQ